MKTSKLGPFSLALITYMQDFGPMTLEQMRGRGLVNDRQTTNRLVANGYFTMSGRRPNVYSLTKKALKCIELGGYVPDEDDMLSRIVTRQKDPTPSRTIWNSTMREPYRTGDGRGRIGLAVTGV